MGDDRRPDIAISTEVMHEIMKRVEADYHDADTPGQRRYITRAGLWFISSFLGSLRGEEVPRLLLKYFVDLNKEAYESRIPHCVLPLYGRFKNDGGIARCYLFRIVCISKSGLDMKKWVDRAIELEKDGKNKFLFSTMNGKKERGRVYESYLFSKIKSIQVEVKGLVARRLVVDEAYGIGRSFRRGSVTEAGNAPNDECDTDDIKRNNRWRTENSAGTRQASLDMLQLYTDTQNSVKADLKFSGCL